MLKLYALSKLTKHIKLILVLVIGVIFYVSYNVKTVSAQLNIPYPQSSVITDIAFNMSTVRTFAPGSDNWTITWADDGHQYTSWGDGGGFGGTNNSGRVSMGVARVEGDKNNYIGYNVWGGYNSENPKQFDGKSVGIISIGGVLYMWRNGDASEGSAFTIQRIYSSLNHGATWQNTGVSFTQSTFPNSKGFFSPTFLQFGKDYQGARDSYVYIYAPENKNNFWDVQTPGEITLIRTLKGSIANQSQYEYFAGLDVNGNPQWTSNITNRKPVFSDPQNGVMRTSVSYNNGLGRYILITQQVSRQKAGNGHIGIYDAPEPWGPWTTVLFTNPWSINLQTGSKTVYWNFSNKWLSLDGKDFVLVYTGPGADEWGTVKGSFTSGPVDTTPPTIPQNLNASAQSESQIDLTWQAATDPESGISKYNIYRDGANVGQSTTTSFLDTGLNEGTTYSYEVSAVNGTGLESAKSTFVSATTIADTTLPTITSVNANGNPSQVIVTFSEPVEQAGAENIINYNIDNGITVSGALLGADLKTVTLTTSPHTDGVSYTLTVNNIKDRASTPNVIAANAQATYTFVAQLVISNLTVASGLNYEVVKDGLQTGAVVYIDRSYTYSSVPALVQGATYIKTANNDKGSSGTSFLTFGVNQDVIVYVAHDDRISTKPSWISSFSDTGDNLVTTDAAFSIFVKDHAAGTITLGGNDGSGNSMYMLVIVGQGNSITDIIPPSSPKGLIIQ